MFQFNLVKRFVFAAMIVSLVASFIAPLSALALDTGYRSPTAQAAGPGGDGNGFEVSPTNAFADDGVFAADMLSGTAATLVCAATTRDRQDFFNYGFSVPAGSAISGIEVRLDAKVDTPVNEKPALCVQLSSDGGATWTAAKSTTPVLTTSEVTYLLGGAADAWGRTWTDASFSNTNFRVRVTSVAYSAYRSFYLDWAAVKVYYSGSGPTATNTSVPPTSTATAVGPTNTPAPTTSTPASSTPTPVAGWNLVWSDEFNGPTINTNNWSFIVSGEGGGNKELEYYTNGNNASIVSDATAQDSKALVIEARQENPANYQCWYGTCQYTSARMVTENKQSWLFGKIVARMRLPYGRGMWPAFWMMGGSTDFWPTVGEIDIMELVGGPATSQCSDCGDDKASGDMWFGSGNGRDIGDKPYPPLPAGQIYADAYHEFGIEWNAQSVSWSIDGNIFYTQSITASKFSAFRTNHFYILMNIAVGGEWPGPPDGTTVWPQRLYVDWVRVYQK